MANAMKGGAKLEAYLAGMKKRLAKGTVRVGYLETAKYPDGTPVAQVAIIQEMGAPAAHIPARPTFRPMIAQQSGTWGKGLAASLKNTGYDGNKSLGQMGMYIAGQLQGYIQAVTAPALSPVTLMLRKMKSKDQSLVVTGKTVGEAAARVAAGESTAGVSTKPLIDTNVMVNSVDSEVVPT